MFLSWIRGRCGALALTAALCGLGAIPAALPAQSLTQPVVRLQSGMHLIQAEVAADERSRAQGLMHRTRLGPNQGMLFVFPEPGRHCFWMRNTLIPLSIAFLDGAGTITHLADMAPQTEDSHCPPGPVRFALEMEQGWFKQRGIKPGSRLQQSTLFQAAPAPR